MQPDGAQSEGYQAGQDINGVSGAAPASTDMGGMTPPPMAPPTPMAAPMPAQPAPAKSKLPIIIIVVVILVVAAGVATALLIKGNSDGDKKDNDSSASKDKDDDKDKDPTPTPEPKFSVAKYGFAINFANTPVETDVSQAAASGLYMEAMQYLDSPDGNIGYMVQVSKYTRGKGGVGIGSSEFDDRKGLDGAIAAMGSSTGAKLVSSSNNGKFLNKYSSADATIQMTSGSLSETMYVKAFIRHDDTVYAYILASIGKTKAEFDAFVDSFEFNS